MMAERTSHVADPLTHALITVGFMDPDGLTMYIFAGTTLSIKQHSPYIFRLNNEILS